MNALLHTVVREVALAAAQRVAVDPRTALTTRVLAQAVAIEHNRWSARMVLASIAVGVVGMRMLSRMVRT